MDYKGKNTTGAAIYDNDVKAGVPHHALLFLSLDRIGDPGHPAYQVYVDTPNLTIYGVSHQSGKTRAWVYPEYDGYKQAIDDMCASEKVRTAHDKI